MATRPLAQPIGRLSVTHFRPDVARVALYACMVAVSLVAILPFVWAFLTSLKPERQIFTFPPQLLPSPATAYNYGRAVDHGLLLALFNSTVISLSTVVLVLGAGSLAAYALARISFRGSQVALFLIIAPMMIPGLVNLVPTYIVMAKLRLLDSYQGLILIYWVHSLPLAIWVLRGFFQTIPGELEDAAAVDGASRLRSLWSIVLPLSQPALAAVALLVFLNAWNEFVIASIMTSSALMRTAQVFLYLNVTDVGVNWGEMMASALAINLPVLALFLLLQRRFIAGLTAGALRF
ncbi:MAG: carbohydrate ABC transporter permease [Chloroflexota bacterium]|nr:carbohydrate ABC transporter permease [Chloroflexota bacterium]